jgi:EAL domain-containing protein (putative c-di-GMP-specific phosphodiesterase class I)/CheY-like chemotaxis protein
MTSPVDISHLNFLVVEDHAFQRWAIGNQLEGLGAKSVVSAEDGRAALALLRERASPIDIVISDLDMPEMDGRELIRHLGEADGSPSIILASGLDRALVASVAAMAREYGVSLLGAIEKPVTAKNLLPLIEQHAVAPRGVQRVADAAREFTLEEVLAGLRGGRIEPYFQPKVDMRSGRVRGAEALARWNHSTEGVVGAVSFVPLLERSGNIATFTAMMVREAAACCRAWLDMACQVNLSLNLSQESLTDTGLADQMVKLIRAEGLDPGDVIFEVPESAMAADVGRALENLSRLRLRGFGLSIDDFGTGYSSMRQLSRVAFTELKIDHSFVRNAADQQPSRAMLESSLEMAGKLNIPAVAEGVESRAEWELLRELGCDLAQGYYIAKPMDATHFMRWLGRPEVRAPS